MSRLTSWILQRSKLQSCSRLMMEMLFEQRKHSLHRQPRLETCHRSNEASYVSVTTQETQPWSVVRGMICATTSVAYLPALHLPIQSRYRLQNARPRTSEVGGGARPIHHCSTVPLEGHGSMSRTSFINS
jgi:hypothetical protein